MSKGTKKRTVTCGHCKTQGHNSRTCPAKAPKVESKPEIKSSADIPDPPVDRKTRLDMRDEEQDHRRQHKIPPRDAPTKGVHSSNDVAPYRCPKCNAVAILVVVKVKDHNASFKRQRDVFKGETRCEQCFNKPQPSDLILKWGAMPDEVVPVPGQDDA